MDAECQGSISSGENLQVGGRQKKVVYTIPQRGKPMSLAQNFSSTMNERERRSQPLCRGVGVSLPFSCGALSSRTLARTRTHLSRQHYSFSTRGYLDDYRRSDVCGSNRFVSRS